jgi:hypothetical protein
MVLKSQAVERRGVRQVATTLNQRQSGAFIHEEYITRVPSRPEVRFHKAGVEEAHEKYHAGR